MSWDPFLMKFLVKKRFVSLVNSARDPQESTEMCFSMKKKKKGEMLKNADALNIINTQTSTK